jgi:hypothetical protein
MAVQLISDPAIPSPSNVTIAALQHLKGIDLPNIQSGALNYALLIVEKPGNDAQMCQAAGKTVVVTAKFSEEIKGSVVIRGSGLPNLSWDGQSDISSFPLDSNQNFYERTFCIHANTSDMNNDLELKFVDLSNGTRWQTGVENVKVPLGQRGHVSTLELSGISFQ